MVEGGGRSGISPGAVTFVDGVFGRQGSAERSVLVVCVFQAVANGAEEKCQRVRNALDQGRTREGGKNGCRMEAATDSADYEGQERFRGSGRTPENGEELARGQVRTAQPLYCAASRSGQATC